MVKRLCDRCKKDTTNTNSYELKFEHTKKKYLADLCKECFFEFEEKHIKPFMENK